MGNKVYKKLTYILESQQNKDEMWWLKSYMFLFQISSLKFSLVQAHGRMLDPPQRGSMWRFGFDVPPNYNDMSNYCGGLNRQWDVNGGKCGVCVNKHLKNYLPVFF